MFLASAGRIYSRKSIQEEFTRYVYDRNVLEVLKSGLICLYEIPVKPTNIREFFAEYLENGAVDIVEISKLRAELCFKKAEAHEMRLKHEKLDKEIFEMEQLQQQQLDEAMNGGDEASPSARNLFRGKSYDRDGKQYEVMNRFFNDLQSYYPGMLSRPESIVFKEDERRFGGEGEGEGELPIGKNLEVSESYIEFIQDMSKFDPWGLVFPNIKKEENMLRQSLRLPAQNSYKSGGIGSGDANNGKSRAELIRESRIDNLKSEREFRLKRKPMPIMTDLQDDIDDDDDAKSIAELFYLESLTQTPSFDSKNPNPALHILKTSGIFSESADHLVPPSRYYDWDTDYWKQFLMEGDILPKFGIVVENTRTSIQGKQWDMTSKDVELQYFNPFSFHNDYDDNENNSAFDSLRQSMEDQVQRVAERLKPLDIQDEVTSQYFQLQNIWTVPQVTTDPLPLHLLDKSRPCECPTVYPEMATSILEKASHTKTSKDKSTIINFVASPNTIKQKELEDVIDTDVVFGDPPLACGKHDKIKQSQSQTTQSSVSSKAFKVTDELVDNFTDGNDVAPLYIPCRNRTRESNNDGKLNYMKTIMNFEQNTKSKTRYNTSHSARYRQKNKVPSSHASGQKGSMSSAGESVNSHHSNLKDIETSMNKRRSSSRGSKSSKHEGESSKKLHLANNVQVDSEVSASDKKLKTVRPSRRSLGFESANKSRISLLSRPTSRSGSGDGQKEKRTNKEKPMKMKKRSERDEVVLQFMNAEDRNRRIAEMDPKSAASSAVDPCIQENITRFHPYPELLVQCCRKEDEYKDMPSKFALFCYEHYDKTVMDTVLDDYGISIFDNM